MGSNHRASSGTSGNSGDEENDDNDENDGGGDDDAPSASANVPSRSIGGDKSNVWRITGTK